MNGRPWTAAEVAQLLAQYPHMSTRLIALMLDRPVSSVYQRALSHGAKKDATYLASPAACRLRPGDTRGAAFRFVKGQPSWNKGISYMPGGRIKDGWFKPGQRSGKAAQHHMPVGAEREIEGYLWVKVADVPNVPYTRNWIAVHILTWERANGPKPPGCAVVFRDGDRRNSALENLELITRAELLRRNWHDRVPKAIKQITQLRGAITRQINKRTRREQPE